MNDTNAIPYLNQAVKINDALLGLPALPLVVLAALACGYFLKSVPVLNPRWIPFSVTLFSMAANLAVTPIEGKVEIGRAVLLGLVGGVAAVIIHRKWLRNLVKDEDVQSNSDPVAFTKPPNPSGQ